MSHRECESVVSKAAQERNLRNGHEHHAGRGPETNDPQLRRGDLVDTPYVGVGLMEGYEDGDHSKVVEDGRVHRRGESFVRVEKSAGQCCEPVEDDLRDEETKPEGC